MKRNVKKSPAKKQPVKRQRTLASEQFKSESAYLKGTDVRRPFDAEIVGVERVHFDEGDKWVLHLADCKSIVLNKTNGAALGADLGDDMDEWTGKFVTVSTTKQRNPRTNTVVDSLKLCGAEVVDEDEADLDEELPATDEDEDLE